MLPCPHDGVQALDGVAAVFPVPGQSPGHGFLRETVADKFLRRDGAFAQPVPAPAIAGIGIGGVLKAVAPQRVQHLVLDRLDGGREIRDQVVRIRIQAHHDRLRQKPGDAFFIPPGLEQAVVDPRQVILLEIRQSIPPPAGWLAEFGRDRIAPGRGSVFGL